MPARGRSGPINGTLQAEFLNLAAFSHNQGAGDAGVQTHKSGSRFGLGLIDD